jgi:selenocysteine lyase/cysteine desulfurase
MLTRLTDPLMAVLRQQEFARLDAEGVAYLDYGGAALYADSQVAAHAARLGRAVLGNPHSENGSSLASTAIINRVRTRVLRFFDAGDDYLVCFTANASAAIKLVAEAYPFGPDAPCVLAADNHNSVNGIREYARRAGAPVHYLPVRDDLSLDDPERRLAIASHGHPLFAFPAQSNFSGLHHPLSLIDTAHALGYRVLLDAAAFVPAHALSLRAHPADFVALSFYKMFGYPTGVGALIARRDALAMLRRPWFAGGTVDYASVQLERHQLRPMHEAFEDGTPNFLDLAAIEDGLSFIERIGLGRIAAHTADLARTLVDGLTALRHATGEPLARVYGLGGERGAAIAFNVLDRNGRPVPYGLVEHRANGAGVHLRGGCFCNPGAAEAAFGFDAARMTHCLDALGRDFSIPRLHRCIGPDVAVGAVRASIGLANDRRDIARCLDVVASFATSTRQETARLPQPA